MCLALAPQMRRPLGRTKKRLVLNFYLGIIIYPFSHFLNAVAHKQGGGMPFRLYHLSAISAPNNDIRKNPDGWKIAQGRPTPWVKFVCKYLSIHTLSDIRGWLASI